MGQFLPVCLRCRLNQTVKGVSKVKWLLRTFFRVGVGGIY